MHATRTLGLLFSLTLLLPASAAGQADSVPVTADAPPEVRLAFHDMEQPRVPRDTVRAYRELLDGLSRRCRYTSGMVARNVITASNLLAQHGVQRRSAYTILQLFDRSATGGPYNSRAQCGQVFPSVLANLMGEAGIPEAKIRNALDALGGLSGSGGGD